MCSDMGWTRGEGRFGSVRSISGDEGGLEEIGDGGVGERGTPRRLHGGPAVVRAAGMPSVARARAEEASRVRPWVVEAVDDAGERQLVGVDGEGESGERATGAGGEPGLGQR